MKTWIKLAALGAVVAAAGCTREVIVPADPNWKPAAEQSEEAVSRNAGGLTVCTRIDPATGTCPAGAWKAVE